jgi:uncharacterized heparinase superfamily protein
MRAPTAGTYWRTLRPLRWSQLGYLALRRALPRSSAPARIKAPVRLRDVPGRWPFLDWQPEASRKMLAAREFTFLNQTVSRNGRIPWNDRRYTKLWLYHLNYFDFLNVGFALPDEEPMLDRAAEIALDWCQHNTEGTEVGWEPYALSVRIVNWLKFLARHGRAMESPNGRRGISILIESLGAQVATLEHRLEKDLLGNHLLKNIKALLFAGALLEAPDSARWWAKGEKLLEQELSEQILSDGGHFERSPMYHSQVLEDLTEIRLLCAFTGRSLRCSALLSRKIQSMARFLKEILHPDGEIPLFNDSVLGGARSPDELLAIAETSDIQSTHGKPQVTLFPDTGYGVIRSPESRSSLIFDSGPLGPDYQPGHGHCDVLSYELSLHGQRVVVDTGASTYEPGPERHYERSTAAHNTLRIDAVEQAEIWGSFRVGRRPRVGRISGGSDGAFHFVSGERHINQRQGLVHARKILLRAPDTWIVADLVRGSGTHCVESLSHFHPLVRVKAQDDLTTASHGLPLRHWQLEFAGQAWSLVTYGEGQLDLIESWYSEQFGKREPSTALRWDWKGTVPAWRVHVFIPAAVPAPRVAADESGKSLEIDGRKIPLVEPGGFI